MSPERRHHFEWNALKKSIVEFILNTEGPVSEQMVGEYLKGEYGEFHRSTINKHLNQLGKLGCIESVQPEHKGKFNFWDVKNLRNLGKIIEDYPDLVERLQNSEPALNIVLDALIDALISSTNPEKTETYKAEYGEIKLYITSIRENLSVKLKMSRAFLKLCIRDEYSLYRNVTELMEISEEGSVAQAFIGDNFKFFVKSTAGIDVAFQACVVMDITEQKGNVRKDLRKEIEYIKQMKNIVSTEQIEQLKKYYEKTSIAPIFIRDKKFVSVHNYELFELQEEFEEKGGKWDYLDDQEKEGPA